MLRITLGISILLWISSIQARDFYKEIPLVKYNGHQSIAVTKHCYEQGYIRPIDNETALKGLKKPINLWEFIDLGNGRIFNSVSYTKMRNYKIKHFNVDKDGSPIGQSIHEELFHIPACENSIIKEKHGRFEERKATPLEIIVYSALYQKGLSTIIIDNSLKSKSLKDVALSDERVRKNLKFKSPNCDNGIINYYVMDMIQGSTEDLSYLGGEGSGHGRLGGEGSGHGRLGGEGSGHGRMGGGLVDVRLTMRNETIRALRMEANWLERLLKLKPKYHKYLNEGVEIPEKLAKVKCKED